MELPSHQQYRVLGVDLSGPANHADTCMAWRDAQGQIQFECDCSDEAIVKWVAAQPQPLLVLIDAPLSYQDGGGYRSCDGNPSRCQLGVIGCGYAECLPFEKRAKGKRPDFRTLARVGASLCHTSQQ